MRFFAKVAALGTLSACLLAQGQEAVKPHPGGHVHKLGSPSTTLSVTVDGKKKQFTLADLQAMPQEDVTVFDKKAKRDMIWSGPSLATLFAACGMPFSAETEHDLLHRYVTATGTDGYMIVSSAGELIENFPVLRASSPFSATRNRWGRSDKLRFSTTRTKCLHDT